MDGPLYFLLCLSMLFQSGSTLKCYVCEASTSGICTKNHPQFREVHCGLSSTNFHWFCLYKAYKNLNTSEEYYSYSCERMGIKAGGPPIFRNLPQCLYKNPYKLITCRVCFTNLCMVPDSSFVPKVNITTFVLLIIISLMFV